MSSRFSATDPTIPPFQRGSISSSTNGRTKQTLETIVPRENHNIPRPRRHSDPRHREGSTRQTPRRLKESFMASALLGEDGRGYDLARRLDACGAWRAWLGDAAYGHFSHALSSPAAWDSFLSPRAGAGAGSVHSAPGRTQIQLQLQLRARALLYDKASAALFLSHPHSINDINPNCEFNYCNLELW